MHNTPLAICYKMADSQPAALMDVTNCSAEDEVEPTPKRRKTSTKGSPTKKGSPKKGHVQKGSPKKGSPTNKGSPRKTIMEPGSPPKLMDILDAALASGSPTKGPGSPLAARTPSSPPKSSPLPLRDTPRMTSRRMVPPPPPPPTKPSRSARPRAKFGPKSQNLQALWHNEWHDISVINGPYPKGESEEPCYDILIWLPHGSSESMQAWPERLIRRNQCRDQSSAGDVPVAKRFPLGCIVWTQVKGAHDWSPGWVVEMPKNEAPLNMRGNPDAYCVQVSWPLALLDYLPT